MRRTRYSGGLETPLSQFSMLRFGMPSSSANVRCVSPVDSRSALISLIDRLHLAPEHRARRVAAEVEEDGIELAVVTAADRGSSRQRDRRSGRRRNSRRGMWQTISRFHSRRRSCFLNRSPPAASTGTMFRWNTLNAIIKRMFFASALRRNTTCRTDYVRFFPYEWCLI